jgi:hypothetical protein
MNFFWNGYECGESHHTYNQGKTLVMVVNKVLFPTYHPILAKINKLYTIISYIFMYLQLI